jgi:hypothetical protein
VIVLESEDQVGQTVAILSTGLVVISAGDSDILVDPDDVRPLGCHLLAIDRYQETGEPYTNWGGAGGLTVTYERCRQKMAMLSAEFYPSRLLLTRGDTTVIIGVGAIYSLGLLLTQVARFREDGVRWWLPNPFA